MTREELKAHCEKQILELLYQEPTTKNDLGVDCISRIETIDYLCKHCPDDGECFKDCDEIKHLRQMPSVTPQEHRWILINEKLPEEKINPTTHDYYEYQCTFYALFMQMGYMMFAHINSVAVIGGMAQVLLTIV